MVQGVRALDLNTLPAAAAAGVSPVDEALPVDGVLPEGLDGCFLQAGPHPALGAEIGGGAEAGLQVFAGPHLVSGIRLDAAGARWYRSKAPVRREEPLGPVPALAPPFWRGPSPAAGPPGAEPGAVAFARPVREAGAAEWHTVATYPGLDHAEHLIAGPDGRVVHASPFALAGAPLVYATAITRRYVIVLDLPVAYSRAADLIGARLPYVWRPDRPARIGLLPRAQGPAGTSAEPRWLPIDPCYVSDVVNAYDDGDMVVLDAVWRARAFADAPGLPGSPGSAAAAADAGRPRLQRWTLDPVTGAVCTRPLVRGAESGTVDGRVSGRRHRYAFASVDDGAFVACHDLAAGTTRLAAAGAGWRFGPPVFAPDERRAEEGAGWLVVVAGNAGRRICELRVLDALDPAGRPRAVVRLPVALPTDRRTAYSNRRS
ncbi:MAG TPA: carotenoid oxygenase family protein [Streptosporangiaceae bacterium]|nr:carotenoid oxygenase family protein [Streptosporangiaceae bacterium]